jgi:hypothetical protein
MLIVSPYMLETRVLLLRPTVSGRPRVIAGAGDGRPVGFAVWVFRPGWWDRTFGPLLCVHEQEDQPLLFTAHTCWWRWSQREIVDAEGERVGYVSKRVIRDRRGVLYANSLPDGDKVVYQCVNGEMLAATRPTQEGLELSFAKVVESDPFAKMLLLAAALLEK